MVRQPIYTIQHAPYTGNTSGGYTTAASYGTPVDREVFGWYPESSSMPEPADTTRRVISRLMVLVPDTSPYSPRDKVTINSLDYFVSEAPRDYTTGPYGRKIGGEIVVERVSG